MKIRIKFAKTGAMKFIGHLDLMRYFQKAIRRADLDICYSAGYNPHQVMSFASPLGVGLTSTGEYFDIEVHQSLSSKDALELLSKQMVEGIELLQYIKLPDDTGNAMSIVSAADYIVRSNDPENTIFSEEAIKDFFSNHNTLMVTKKTKKSEIEMDLIPYIHEYKGIVYEGVPSLRLRLSAGSEINVKPSLFLSAYTAYFEQKYTLWDFPIHRLDIFAKYDDTFISLGDLGVDLSE